MNVKLYLGGDEPNFIKLNPEPSNDASAPCDFPNLVSVRLIRTDEDE